MISGMQDDFDVHRIKCMTKPRLKFDTFELDEATLSSMEEECTICFDEFEVGQVCARLECLCVFHKSCLENWLSRKQCKFIYLKTLILT